MQTFLLIGFFGRGNFGDDAMAEALVGQLLKHRENRILLVTNDTQFADSVASDRLDRVDRHLLAILFALFRSNILVQVGGTVFHDSYKGRFFIRYHINLLAWLCLFAVAKAIGCRILILGAGVGPLKWAPFRGISRLAFSLCDAILVRDHASLNTMARISARDDAILGFDLAVLSDRLTRPAQPTLCQSTWTLGISVCSLAPFITDARIANAYWERLTEALAIYSSSYPIKITLFSLYSGTSSESDETVSIRIASQLPTGIEVDFVTYSGNIAEIVRAVDACDAIIATKYHAAVTAYLRGVRFSVVAYNEKVRDFAREVHLPEEYIFDLCPKSVTEWMTLLRSFHTSLAPALLDWHYAQLRARQAVEKSLNVDRMHCERDSTCL